jgi:hypothetical protein
MGKFSKPKTSLGENSNYGKSIQNLQNREQVLKMIFNNYK